MREFGTAPSLAELEAIALQELERVPLELRRHCEGIGIQIQDFPDDELLDDLDIESPFELMGIYQGIPLTERSLGDVRHEPDIILLFRRPILDFWCEEGENLREVIRHVLIHEIGHHFGFSDDDMERIEQEMTGQ